MTKETLPTVSIKGKDYVMVKDRLAYFNQEYPNGTITTEIISYQNGQVVMKAWVKPDYKETGHVYTGYSQAKESDGMINKTSALENAETSAVGRALAMMGIGVIESVASADEVVKAIAPVKHSAVEGFHEEIQRKGVETDEEKDMREAIKADEDETRDCPKHPGKSAWKKQTPWGVWQWSHKQDDEPKGYCNINIA